jgi:DGQHR domain-containing protein
MQSKDELRVLAIETKQNSERTVYTFSVDGKLIPSFATVSRIRRDDNDHIAGYQRPEVRSHINEIRNYIESETPMIPNSVVIAFDPRVRFEASNDGELGHQSYTRFGTLIIPIDPEVETEDKPGFIVDGQQRVAAIREAEVDSFPIFVNAFITSDVREQTEQFILVNSTKPLPKGLIYELLPNTDAALSTHLRRRKFPSYLLDLLNHSETSPLKNMIQTPTTPNGVIKDNSILKMLENSLSDGVLFRFCYKEDGPGDVDSMIELLQNFWRAVRNVFPDAWDQSTRRSRLMHGAGIISMGFLMDTIAERHRKTNIPTEEQFTEDLYPLAEYCRWTDGYWEFAPGYHRKWSEIQNVSRDIQLLTNYLVKLYKQLVWNKDAKTPSLLPDLQSTLFH